MSPRKAFSSFLGNYVNLSGRATRSEYWWASLYLAVVNTILAIVGVAALVTVMHSMFSGSSFSLASLASIVMVIAWVILGIINIGTFLPGLALTVRRLHDTNRSAW